jgi:predicted alpha-1,2-mannosidase
MKYIFFASILLNYFSFSAQINESIQKLKDSQDTRKKYLNRDAENMKTEPAKVSYVNPFIGTGGHGHTYPGAASPFGMMQLSPDTRFDGWDGCSGYHYSDSIIYGFSHTHLSGTGVPDYCDLLLVPQSGTPKIQPGYKVSNGYGSKFSHASEKAEPGYYQVNLIDSKIKVRLTVGERSGMHEYTFSDKEQKKYVLIDLDHRDKVLQSNIIRVNKTTLSGYRISKSWANEQHFYFELKTNIPYKKAKLINKKGQYKLLLEFPKETEKLLIKVGMSAVDNKGAKANLETEIPEWDFNALRINTLQKWEAELNKIKFYPKNVEISTKFYTALYHSYLNPNIFSDVDGRYRGLDKTIHKLPNADDNQYSVFSIWDTYRATHPLFTLTQEKRTNEMIRTFLRHYDESGDLPVWELAGNETECMIGYHSVSVISDAFAKGIQDFNTEKALKAMIATSTFNEYGKQLFQKNGYINLALEPESVSKSLEYAYDDFCISQFAKNSGNKEIELKYELSSLNFINSFDPKSKFMRARRSGLWYSPFDPTEVNFNYTEANSWQYSLYAPHAVGVLRELHGGKDSLESYLDNLFTTTSALSGRNQVDITGLIGQYAHGNEPSHHMAYLYNYTKNAHKTQYYTDKIMKEMYTILPDGLSGNEDCGQMSSWYVLSAMGIYQIAPGNPYYEFGRPLGSEVILALNDNKEFRIYAENNLPDNIYIQKITLNGKEIKRLYISHEEIMNGGKLVFEMGPQPNIVVDNYEHAPTISSVPHNFTPVPYFEQVERTFDYSMKVSINYPLVFNKNYAIKYTTDGTEPTEFSTEYTGPISISKTTHFKTALFNRASKTMGVSVENEFRQREPGITLDLKATYSNQYAAGGQKALIDGITGGNEFRTGDWQGFNDQDVIAEVSFLEPKKIKEIGLSCIQDQKSWIFFPQSVSYEISTDGIKFTPLYTISTPLEQTNKENSTFVYLTQTNTNEPIMKIRVKAKNFGKCPAYHLGAGNPTWLFADEIIYR